ncbi:probable protein phosphatase 2C 27 [Miscanthus floridulus]|uniref:probable protein phosphatase 2C 27 n=1 Tax=Miscanthus floridulus TaxID=154761 RepID=UPI00345AEA2D
MAPSSAPSPACALPSGCAAAARTPVSWQLGAVESSVVVARSSDDAEARPVGGGEMERVCENTTSADFRQKLSNFVPVIRSGDWSDIGGRQYMEDTHVCIPDLAKNFGFPSLDNEVVSFYGVSIFSISIIRSLMVTVEKMLKNFVRDNLPRVIVEDSDFPLQLEKVVRRSFMQIDCQFAETCSLHRATSSGTTALTAMIFGSLTQSTDASALQFSQHGHRCFTVLVDLVVAAAEAEANEQ